MSDPTEEFEAVWAVVRRLEAHIRRLEGSIAHLQQEVDLLKAIGLAEPAPGEGLIDLPPEPPPADAVPVAPEPPPELLEPSPGGVYRVVFDGGSLGNPGHGYGSYQIESPTGRTLTERLDFASEGVAVTNNQAEYLTLIRALEDLRDRLADRAADATVEIRGDSQLVVNQLNGRWKVRNAELQPLHERARRLLAMFGRADLIWHARANSVKTLGH